ncbi:hypothetical protein G6F68_021819 [Rhizopus microsporus]|nr:hypothetical protein G6F68_021819 [Rhizopus microsporus]
MNGCAASSSRQGASGKDAGTASITGSLSRRCQPSAGGSVNGGRISTAISTSPASTCPSSDSDTPGTMRTRTSG